MIHSKMSCHMPDLYNGLSTLNLLTLGIGIVIVTAETLFLILWDSSKQNTNKFEAREIRVYVFLRS